MLLMAAGCSSSPDRKQGSGGWEETIVTSPEDDSSRGASRDRGRDSPSVDVRDLPPPPALGKIGSFLSPSWINPADRSLMVLVPSGKYRVGSRPPPWEKNSRKENGSRRRALKAFYIDRTEITVEQYKRFDPKYDEKPYRDGEPCPACPAMGIDWKGGSRYCRWAQKQLPSEAEWEAAARGDSENPWPWGMEFNGEKTNLHGEEDGYLMAAPAGSFPQGASPSGAEDMIGNVWEWVRTPYPIATEKRTRKSLHPRMIKGGGWTSPHFPEGISLRNPANPKLKNPTIGFRCVRPVE